MFLHSPYLDLTIMRGVDVQPHTFGVDRAEMGLLNEARMTAIQALCQA
jgi:hypothetical protein